MEIDEEMTSSTVKEQLNQFKVKKITKLEAQNPLKWWKNMRYSSNFEDCRLRWRESLTLYRYLHKPLTLLIRHNKS
jgi:hypothetical protein